MTINIQNASNVFVEGHRSRRNCKPVMSITTGEVYASLSCAAEANEISQPTLSWLIANNGKSRKTGKKFCFVSDIMEHLDEITNNQRELVRKAAAYDEIMDLQQKQHDEMIAKETAIRVAETELAERKARCEELRQALEAEMSIMADVERELNELRGELK